MNGSVVFEHPKGVFTRLMPGSKALELYHEYQRGNFGKKSKPGPAAYFLPHMEDLHAKFLKERGEAK